MSVVWSKREKEMEREKCVCERERKGGGERADKTIHFVWKTPTYHSLSLPPLSDGVVMFFVDSSGLFWCYRVTARLSLGQPGFKLSTLNKKVIG